MRKKEVFACICIKSVRKAKHMSLFKDRDKEFYPGTKKGKEDRMFDLDTSERID